VKNSELNYCFRIIFEDSSEWIYKHFTLTPELLVSVFDNGGSFDIECNNFNDLINLFYKNVGKNVFAKKNKMEVQIFNKATNKVLYCKKFNAERN